MKIKRGTTPTITITIHAPFNNVKEVNFIFKTRPDDYGREILTKEYKGNIPLKEGEATNESFKVLMRLTKEETLCFSVGKAYMDTQVVYSDGTIPDTKVVEVDVEDTFFDRG